MDLVSVVPAAVGAAVQLLLMAQDVPGQDLAEGVPEVLYAVGVDDGVDCRVGVRQNDGQVHDDIRLLHVVKQREAVDDVDGQPADGEQSHNDGEGFGGPDLLLQQAVVVALAVAHALELDLSELPPGHGEDLHIDAEHDEQRRQHAHKEVKVHHVLHVHHALEEAREPAALKQVPPVLQLLRPVLVGSVVAIGAALQLLVPTKEGNKANDKGEDP